MIRGRHDWHLPLHVDDEVETEISKGACIKQMERFFVAELNVIVSFIEKQRCYS